jgi:hypothetical protein
MKTLQWFLLRFMQLIYCNNLFTVVVAFTVMDSLVSLFAKSTMDSSQSFIAFKTMLRGPGSGPADLVWSLPLPTIWFFQILLPRCFYFVVMLLGFTGCFFSLVAPCLSLFSLMLAASL